MVIYFSDIDAKELQWGKRSLFKLCWNDGILLCKKTEFITRDTHINSSCIIKQNEKAKTIKYLQ